MLLRLDSLDWTVFRNQRRYLIVLVSAVIRFASWIDHYACRTLCGVTLKFELLCYSWFGSESFPPAEVRDRDLSNWPRPTAPASWCAQMNKAPVAPSPVEQSTVPDQVANTGLLKACWHAEAAQCVVHKVESAPACTKTSSGLNQCRWVKTLYDPCTITS